MKVLIACEESQRVCTAFRERGHDAYSCDVLDCSGGHPEWHIKQNVIPLLNGNCSFTTMDSKIHVLSTPWDLIIAHPPCTFLSVSGNAWFNTGRYGKAAEERWKNRVIAAVFFMRFVSADCEKIAIENPIGIMSTAYQKPDQIIQPYYFGHPVSKSTCLWLKGLPCLQPTEIVTPENIHSAGKSGGYSGSSWYVKNQSGKILRWSDPETAKERSKTYLGIARAMAEQWG